MANYKDLPRDLVKQVSDGYGALILGNQYAASNLMPGRMSFPTLLGQDSETSLEKFFAKYIKSRARKKLLEDIRELLKDALPSPVHHYVPRFHWGYLFTFNYDTLMEDTVDCFHRDLFGRIDDKTTRVSQHLVLKLRKLFLIHRAKDVEDFLGHQSVPPPIRFCKLQGCLKQIGVEDAEPLLNRRDYKRLRRIYSDVFKKELSYAATNLTLVVVGMRLDGASLEQDYARTVFRSFRGIENERYVVNAPAEERRRWKRYGFDNIDMDDLAFFEKLYRAVKKY